MKILALFLSYSEEVRSNADSCQLRQPGQGAVCTSSPMGMGWISDTVGEAGQGAVYTSSPLGQNIHLLDSLNASGQMAPGMVGWLIVLLFTDLLGLYRLTTLAQYSDTHRPHPGKAPQSPGEGVTSDIMVRMRGARATDGEALSRCQ